MIRSREPPGVEKHQASTRKRVSYILAYYMLNRYRLSLNSTIGPFRSLKNRSKS